jgi:5,10-methylene-tetrahydrofolate dehydrogenase/methenyl tetrahydrofolate cyclohydrolase
MPERIDCRSVAKRYREWIRARLSELDVVPGIATILIKGKVDPGSLQYRDMIIKDAEALGVASLSVEVEDEHALVQAIGKLNVDSSIQGIVVLYPLGLTRRDDEIMDLVTPRKDIEGLHSINLGYLIKYRRFLNEDLGLKCVVPATAKAVVKSLQAYPRVPIEGAFITIVNNSMRVGKPLGLMLENLGATVIKCYDQTRPEILESSVRNSDIVVTAVPDPSFKIDPDWIKSGAAVVDVSYQGNIDSKALEGRAALTTAPDNRIGRLTRALMFVNLLYSCGPQPSFDPRESAVQQA